MAKKEKVEITKPTTHDEAVANTIKVFDEMDKNFSAFKNKRSVIDVVDTGSPNINNAIKIHGYPRGRMTQIYGPYGSGKSFLALCGCANAVKKDSTAIAVWFDAEHSFNYEWAKKLGVWDEDPKKSRIRVIKGNKGIAIFERLVGKIKKDKFGTKKVAEGIIDYVKNGSINCPMIVIDSLASIISPREDEAPVGGLTVAALPLFLNTELKRVVSLIEESDIALVCLNQVRQSIGDSFEEFHFPGGETLKHLISLNLYVERIKQKEKLICLEEGEKNTLIGQAVNVLVEKNRFGPVPRKCETTFLFTEGAGYDKIGVVNFEKEIVDLACESGLMKKSGGWYTLPDGSSKYWAGVEEYIKNNPGFLDSLYNQIKQNVVIVESEKDPEKPAQTVDDLLSEEL